MRKLLMLFLALPLFFLTSTSFAKTKTCTTESIVLTLNVGEPKACSNQNIEGSFTLKRCSDGTGRLINATETRYLFTDADTLMARRDSADYDTGIGEIEIVVLKNRTYRLTNDQSKKDGTVLQNLSCNGTF